MGPSRQAVRSAVPTHQPEHDDDPHDTDRDDRHEHRDLGHAGRPRVGRPLPQRGHGLDPGRWDERAEPQPGDQAAEMRRVVDARDDEPEGKVEQDQHPELADERPTLPIDRVVDATAVSSRPNSPNTAPDAPDRRASPPKTKLPIEPAAAHAR